MARFAGKLALALAIVFAIDIAIEEGLKAAGLATDDAQLLALAIVIALIYAARNRLTLDDPWTLGHPATAGILVAVVLTAALTVWFLLTEDDRDVALAASALGAVLAAACGAGCFWRWRRLGRVS